MKEKMKTMIAALAMLYMIGSAQAKIWRVDNNVLNNPDFTELQAAQEGATEGDTIYVAGSSVEYSQITINKRLYLFGPGYFLSENQNTQAVLSEARVAGLDFDVGSDGSVVAGFVVSNTTDISDNNITIKRMRLASISVHNNASNIMIVQNFMNRSNSTLLIGFIASNSQNIIIKNNYLKNSSYTCVSLHSGCSGILSNNIIDGKIELNNTNCFNNILVQGTYSGSNNNIHNNIANSTQFGTENGNQSNVDMNTVFIGTGSTDGKWQLKLGSPAIGAGEGGVDCGMFGGLDPYVLSGLPAMPAIYYFNAPISGSESGGLPVQVKIKSHD